MAFTKGMKKGLSVLLSLAMVVTSVSINGKTADAAAGDVTVTATNTAEKLTDNKVTVTGAVEEAADLQDSELSVSVVKLKTENNALVENGAAEGFTPGEITIGTEDTTTFSVDLTVADTVEAGDYRVKVSYVKDGSSDDPSIGSADFKVNPQYSIAITNATENVLADAKDVTFNGTVKAWDNTPLNGEDIVTISTTAEGVTLPEKVTVEDGEFSFKAELDGLKEVTASVITATVAGTNEATYSADATIAVVPKAGVIASLVHVGSGWYPQYWGFPGATSEQNVAVDATKAGEYTLSLDSTNWGTMAFVQFNDVNDDKRDFSANVGDVVIKSVKVDGSAVEAGENSKVEKYISYDEENGFRINLFNCYWDEASNYFAVEKTEGDYALTDPTMASKSLEITFEVKKDFVASEETPGVGDKEEAKAASVTGITMAPNAITATAGAVTTKAAVLTVSGSALDLLAANNVTVSAVSTSGITVALATKAAVTATAAAATFEAVVTVPTTCATGNYVLVASAGAVTASVATVSVIAADVPVEEDVHTTKLTVKTANGTNKVTMGVGETAKLKVTKKPAKSVDAVTAKSAKAKVVKASMKGKNLVLKAKKVGKAKVTLTSGTVTKKITVTVMKAPKKLSLKDGKKAAKKTVKLNAKTKKNVTKKYKVVLPKKTASYGYTIKKSGKKAIIKKAAVTTNKKGVQTLVITVKKKAKGNAKVVVTSAANKKAKATVKVKASK